MGRLGMLYAITDQELGLLKGRNTEDLYEFMMEEIEDKYFATARACELDKAWEGIHFSLNNGKWLEDGSGPSKVIFCGDFLLDGDYVITWKSPDDVKGIVEYLTRVDLENTIKAGFQWIPQEEYSLPKDEDNLQFLLDWCEGIKEFYENAEKENLSVIFTVDL